LQYNGQKTDLKYNGQKKDKQWSTKYQTD
jgi:hypothetical protein